MTLPSFLVIGAMKAGSTTLYEDLRGNSGVFLPEKELGGLLAADVRSPEGARHYRALFRAAEPGQVVGDVSADYAKLPRSTGLAETALAVLGADHRVVYSLRNPVDRLVSHHHHSFARGEIENPDIDLAVASAPELVDWSRYATQIQPFLDTVGQDRILMLAFEDYMADRAGGFAGLAGFLGLSGTATATDPDTAFNTSATGHVAVGRWARVLRGQGYRRLLRPLVPVRVRTGLRDRLLPATPPRPAPPSAATLDRVLEELAPELARLRELGFVAPASWGRERTHERYAERRTLHQAEYT